MAQTADYFGNFPFSPGEKKPVVMTRDRMKRYIYPPENAHFSDLNWLIASTDKLTVGIYQLAPGASFDPPDIHAGDEAYYMLHGTISLLNPESGECIEVSEGEAALIPEGGWHKAYNFGSGVATILFAIAPKIWNEEGNPLSYPGEMKIFRCTATERSDRE
jgi:mannose-6-phosphate isomerase-like protein (cupin superfamily)